MIDAGLAVRVEGQLDVPSVPVQAFVSDIDGSVSIYLNQEEH